MVGHGGLLLVTLGSACHSDPCNIAGLTLLSLASHLPNQEDYTDETTPTHVHNI